MFFLFSCLYRSILAARLMASSFAVTLANKAAQERLDSLQKDSFKSEHFFDFTKTKRSLEEEEEEDGK